MSYRTWVEINQHALQENIRALQNLLNSETRFCAVLKANAYGHGLKETALVTARSGVDAFGVDAIDDALFLRDLLPGALLIVLGYTLHERLIDAVEAAVELTVYDEETLCHLEELAASRAKETRVHLKIETGTSRQGILAEDLPSFCELLARCPHVRVTGVSTHFADVENAEDPTYANQQFLRFVEAQKVLNRRGFDPLYRHCACSTALILYPDTHGTLVRAGISLYGIWPSEATETAVRRHRIPLELTPVLTWKTRIAQIKSLPAGTPVGYGRTETLRRKSRIAVLPVGYWDGYDRGLSSIGEVLIGTHRCKILGRVAMNMTVVDVSDVPQIEREQEVVLLGRMGHQEISAWDVAQKIETIPYEILARINPLLPRVAV